MTRNSPAAVRHDRARRTQPRWGCARFGPATQGSGFAATQGFTCGTPSGYRLSSLSPERMTQGSTLSFDDTHIKQLQREGLWLSARFPGQRLRRDPGLYMRNPFGVPTVQRKPRTNDPGVDAILRRSPYQAASKGRLVAVCPLPRAAASPQPWALHAEPLPSRSSRFKGKWRGRRDSNPQPPVPKTGALSVELRPRAGLEVYLRRPSRRGRGFV